MGPKTSFMDMFTNEGRIKRMWAQALEEPDPRVCLNQLRVVRQKLQEDPAVFAHLGVHFLDTFLDAQRIRLLTSADIMAVEEMGNALVHDPGGQLRPEHVWFRALNAYIMRGEERQACVLFAKIYRSPSATWEEKTRCIRELAHRSDASNDSLNLYIDYLQHSAAPATETQILAILSNACVVDFNTNEESLKRARFVAWHLLNAQYPARGLWTALGLYSLLVERKPAEAATYLERALGLDPADKTALLGLLAAWIQDGKYDKAIEGKSLPTNQSDAIVAGLLHLSRIIQWLDSRDLSAPPPRDAQSVEYLYGLGLSKYVGDMMDATLGRVYLLVGNAARAAEVFRPLLSRNPGQPQWSYYGSWAEMLIGNPDGVAYYFSHARQWSGGWTVACLLLDTDSSLAERNSVHVFLKRVVQGQVRQPYLSLIEARLALAHSSQPPQVTWEAGSGTIEEEMEALRTRIGVAFYSRNVGVMEKLISDPLFARLPRADQLFWQGLIALYLKGQSGQGFTLLEQAAIGLGYQRAALVLAMYFLEQNRIEEARRYLERVTRVDGNVGLLRAYIAVSSKQMDVAIRQLEQQVALPQSMPKVHFALGNLLLQKAASMVGQPDQMRHYREQAARVLQTALKTGREGLPNDAEAVAYCAQFVANPQQGAHLHTTLWNAFTRLNPSQQQSWVKWNATLAQVWYGDPAEVIAADQVIYPIIDLTNQMKDTTVAVFAQALAKVSTKVEQVEHADKLIRMLERLLKQSKLQTVKQSCQLGITRGLQVRYLNTDIQQRHEVRQKLMRHANQDQTNGTLSLLLARVNLENSAKRAAVTALRNAQPQEDRLQRLCTCLADLLDKEVPRVEIVPPAESANTAGYEVLQIATAFAANRPDQGYEKLSLALRQHTHEVTSLINVERMLPALCAYWMKDGNVPPHIAGMIRELSSKGVSGAKAATLARCAAAIGELEDACRFWEQSLADAPNKQFAREYARVLCHLAVTAHNAGNDQEAVRRLRQAARWLKESGA